MKRLLVIVLLLFASQAFAGPVVSPTAPSKVITATKVDITTITDGNIPYMQSGAAGFGDSPLSTDGTDLTATGDITADTVNLGDITDNNIPKMGASGFEDSAISDDGSGNVAVQSGTDSTTGFQVLDADGGTPVLNVDTVNEQTITNTLAGGTATTSDLNLKTTTGAGTTGADMHFLVGNNGATEAMTILNDGKVGIGTAAPTQKLDINGNINLSSGSNLYWNNGDIGILNSGANILFKTYSGSLAERMRIDSTGNVGINTTAPQSLLDVQGAAAAPGILTLATKETTVVASDELGRINFNAPLEASGTDAILPGASIWAVAEGDFAADSNATSLVFATGSSEAASEKAKIDSNGTFHFEAGQSVKKTNVADTAYGTSALTTDYIVSFTSLTAARAAVISSEDVASGTATQPRIMVFKDESGNAGTYPITISLESGGTINGASTYVLNTNYEAINIYLDGTNGFAF